MYVVDGKLAIEGLNPDGFPTLEDGRWDDRTDPKWAHPEFTGSYDMMDQPMMQAWSFANDPCATPEERRAARDAQAATFAAIAEMYPVDGGITMSEYAFDALEGDERQITAVVAKPAGSEGEKLPVLFTFGQGSLLLNSPDMQKILFNQYVTTHGCAAVFIAARTAVDAPNPAELDDYEAGYRWMEAHAEELGFDLNRVVLIGDSGGANVALCFAFRCKRLGIPLRGVVALEPAAITDSFNLPSQRIVTGDWDGIDALRTHKFAYRAADQFSPFRGPESVPCHATVEDCRGLAPVFLHLLEMDPDRDPGIELAKTILEARSFCQVHVWGGITHAAFSLPVDGPMKEAMEACVFADIHDCFEYDLNRPWA